MNEEINVVSGKEHCAQGSLHTVLDLTPLMSLRISNKKEEVESAEVNSVMTPPVEGLPFPAPQGETISSQGVKEVNKKVGLK